MEMIEVKNLSFSYDGEHKAIENVSFCVEKGSYTTIIGHNGSGKSTVAKLVAGILEKSGGEIHIDGLSLEEKNIRSIRHKVGIVFQNPDNQFIGSTVRDDIAFGLENHCVAQEKMDEIIERFAERVKMTEYLNSEPRHLSGGQKQRVAIAGVLAMHPDIIIFDEATSMLDPQGKADIKKVIMDLHQESGLTILSITHDIDEVTNSDKAIVLNEGRVVAAGTPSEIFSDGEKLTKMRLDIPFALKLSIALQERGILDQQSITMEGVVNDLCRLNLKK